MKTSNSIDVNGRKRSLLPRRVSSMTFVNEVNHNMNHTSSSDDTTSSFMVEDLDEYENTSISSHVSFKDDNNEQDRACKRHKIQHDNGNDDAGKEYPIFDVTTAPPIINDSNHIHYSTSMNRSMTSHEETTTTIIENSIHNAITPVSSRVSLLSYNSNSPIETTPSTTTMKSIVVGAKMMHVPSPPTNLNDLELSNSKKRSDTVSLIPNVDICSNANIPLISQEPSVLCEPRRISNKLGWASWLVSILFIIVAIMTTYRPTPHIIPKDNHENSVCVSGGGFSGFWFTLGRLQNGIIVPSYIDIEASQNTINNTNHRRRSNSTSTRKEYYCYSSGCLGVVAALSRYSMEDMWNMAYNIQLQWKSGQLDRYDVVTSFVDDLLFGKRQQQLTTTSNTSLFYTNHTRRLNLGDLSSLNIMTSVKDGRWGIQPSIRTPRNVLELRTMLIQTTWIPFAIGNNLWYENHMDGAFTTSSHPKCHYNVGLAYDLDLYTNVINVNLGRDKVENFWNKGLEFGL